MHGMVVWGPEKGRIHGKTDRGAEMVFSAGGSESPSLPTPMEAVLLAWGGCTLIDVVKGLETNRKKVLAASIDLEAPRVEGHPKVFSSCEMVYRIKGENIRQTLVERLVTLSHEKYCSVGAMLGKAVPFSYRVEVESV